MGACILVDQEDTVLGYGESNKLAPNDCIRITAVWITSPEGKILMALRSIHKKHEPNVWGPAVAGTVEPNETYEENAYKEIEEEIGIKANDLTLGPKTVRPNRICQWYILVIPESTPLHPRPREVDELRWFTREELVHFFKGNPHQFTSGAGKYLPLFIEGL